MIKVDGLSKSYGGNLLFSNLSFQLTKGERCSLIGRNGSGKSTLLRCLLGLETQDKGTITLPKNYDTGYLEQHISFSKKNLLEETALSLTEEEAATPYRAEAMLFGLGFSEEDLEKDPSSFSGGYQLRIQLAKTLLKEPDCLLLDEPTNYLDIVSIRWLESFLKSWKGEMILISHDKTFLDSISTHTMGIHRGKLYRVQGGCQQFYDHILQIEEVHEKTRLKIDKQKESAEDYIRRFGTKATKAKQAQSRKKAIERLPSLEKLAAIEGLDFHFNALPFPGRRQLRASEIEFQYPGQTELLVNKLSFEIEPGDRIAIIGKNGRGKSTILRLLAKDLSPDKGVFTFSENLSIAYFGQTNIQKLNPSLTILEEVQLASPNLPFAEVRKICGQMMFSGSSAEKKIRVLSGGEKSRVLLGKILASPCNLLLLDEPTNHLDIESVEALLEALEDFSGSVIIVSHDEEILHRTADKLIICRKGKQEFFPGDYAYFLEKLGWEEADKRKRPTKENKKEVKKRRAEIIQERSKFLNPIKSLIEKKEKEIEREESKLTQCQNDLESALADGDQANLPPFIKLIGEATKKVERLYQELELLYKDLEMKSKSFDQSLAELGSDVE